MLKHQTRLSTQIAIVIDTTMIVAAYFAAYCIAGNFTSLGHRSNYDWILLWMIPVWLYLIEQRQLYKTLRTKKIVDITVDVLKVHVIGTVVVTSIIFLLDPRGFSRVFFGTCVLSSLIFIVGGKLIIRRVLFYLRYHGLSIRYLLLVGCNETSAEMIQLIQKHPGWGLVISGIAEDEPDGEKSFYGVKIIGSVDDVIPFCRENPVDEVIWCLEHSTEEQENIFVSVQNNR